MTERRYRGKWLCITHITHTGFAMQWVFSDHLPFTQDSSVSVKRFALQPK
jgi:hypothetical protein